jgi:hypothetical protein
VALALKVTVLEPAPTLTDVETETAASLLAMLTVAVPPVGTGPLKVAVHENVPGPVSDRGLQLNSLSGGAGVAEMVPALPDTVTGLPAGEEANGFVMPIVVLLTVDATVKETTATTPFWITFVLIPAATQLKVPAGPAHVRLFPCDVSAVAALTLRETISLGE